MQRDAVCLVELSVYYLSSYICLISVLYLLEWAARLVQSPVSVWLRNRQALPQCLTSDIHIHIYTYTHAHTHTHTHICIYVYVYVYVYVYINMYYMYMYMYIDILYVCECINIF